MKNVAYVACSLDGYIAEADGGLEWLTDIPNETHDDYGFTDFLHGIDGILMGRITFETVLGFGFWPYEKPVFILSRTLTKVPEAAAGKAEIVRGDLASVLKRLHARGIENIYVDGGKVIQSFLEADLMDEMTITIVSKLLGNGIRLFAADGRDAPLEFEVVRSEILNSFMVKTLYRRKR